MSEPIRCAVYTRKSTEEGLDQEFNSLNAQREAAEAYIRSQAQEGWACLPTHYDDGGYTGANMERPALQRLLADIAAKRIDVVVCHKVDRLSRSLLDFARMMETFEQHGVSFVSITQQFNSATSMGRLVLNVLLSFAQFEREIIAERTRDKIAATRRKGKWAGGHAVLGYDVDPRALRLMVNKKEATRVRAIFELFLEKQSLSPVVRELARRRWASKHWLTRSGRVRGGKPFTSVTLYRLLTNPIFTGRVRYKEEVHAGEHAALVDDATWQKVQALLRNRIDASAERIRSDFLLQGLLYCAPCGCRMSPCKIQRGHRRYRYYICSRAQRRGWHCCPSQSLRADTIEPFVLQQVQDVLGNPGRLREVMAQAGSALVEEDALRVLSAIDLLGDSLPPNEQTQLLRRLVARLEYDGSHQKIVVNYRPEGMSELINEQCNTTPKETTP